MTFLHIIAVDQKRLTVKIIELEMWAISDALPLEAALAPSPGLNSTTDLGEGW